MPGLIKTLLYEEAQKFERFISQNFRNIAPDNYFALIIDARTRILIHCLPDNFSKKNLHSRALKAYSLRAIDFIYKSGNEFLKDDNYFFVPIRSNNEMIGGIAFYSFSHKIVESAYQKIIKFVSSSF